MTYGFIYDITIIIKIQKQRLTNMAKKFVIEDGVLTNYNGSASNVVIPDGVTSIERFAFSECKHIKKSGYTSLRSFNRNFKLYVGVSPRNFRSAK